MPKSIFERVLYIFYTYTYLYYTFIPYHTQSLSLPFTETLFALSLATNHHVTPSSVSLNVISHLWLRPFLFIAGQLKCEGSQWEDKYKSKRDGGVSQTKAGSSLSLSLLSALLLASKVKKKTTESLIDDFEIIYFCCLFVVCVEYLVQRAVHDLSHMNEIQCFT